jgi:type II secretory pathway pseudopilin PulG
MEKPASLLKVIQHLCHKQAKIKRLYSKGDAGYTLLELIILVILIGVIAGIAAPGWLGFVQQRRVNAASDVVLRALQEAQSQAKNKKLSYSVAFRNIPGKVPEIAVYQTRNPDPTIPGQFVDVKPAEPSFNQWRSLGQDLELKPRQVTLGTNLSEENKQTAGSSISYVLSNDADINRKKITFDYQGALPVNAARTGLPLIIVIAAPSGGDIAVPVESTIRCVKVTTLLGAITKGRGRAECGV